MAIYRYRASARGARALIAVALWWSMLLAAAFLLDAARWIVLPLALVSMPALYEIGRGSTATFELDATEVRWSSGGRSARVALSEIARIRLDTRLDFSRRMSLVLKTGTRVRLPYECVPPAKSLDAECSARQIEIERHHFSLLG